MPGRESMIDPGPIMRNTRAERARAQTSWRVSIALALCFALVLAGLHTIVADFAWWFALMALVVGLLLGLGSRAHSRVLVGCHHWLPSQLLVRSSPRFSPPILHFCSSCQRSKAWERSARS